MSMVRLLKKDNRNLNVLMYILKHSVINFILVCNAQSIKIRAFALNYTCFTEQF